jgi:MFS family permease
VSERAATIRRVASDPTLRRVELSFAGFSLSENATWLAMVVVAFDRGGTGEAGTIVVLALGCAVVVAPFAAYAGDRFSPRRALAIGFVVQSVAMGVTAGAMGTGMVGLAYAGMIIVSGSVTFTRPVVASLLPAVTHRPADLVAANVVLSALGDTGVFIGPLIAAVFLTVASPTAVFATFAVVTAGAAVLSSGIRLDIASSLAARAPITAATLRLRVGGGLNALLRQPTLRLLVMIMSISAFSAGVVDVLIVTVADDRLEGKTNVGVLAAAVGLGSVIGALATSAFIGRPQLAVFAAIGATALALPMLGVVDSTDLGVVLASLALVGVGQSVLLVVGTVALQRWAPPEVLARIFGIHESIQMLSMACGAAAFSVLADRTSLQPAVIALGAAILLVAASTTWRLVASGADVPPPPAELIDRLHADPIFAPLDVRAMEKLASGAVWISRPSGSMVIVEGEPGDRYYLVVDGLLQVTKEGAEVRRLGPGNSFGEIALLRDVPRSATVVAIENARLLAIGRDQFIAAVTGHPTSATVAATVADRY